LEQFVAQGVFQHVDAGQLRVGRLTHRILWHHNRVHRFVLDFDAGAVTIPSLLPATLPPRLVRELRCILRQSPSSSLAERAQLDPDKAELRIFMKHGSLTFSMTVRSDCYEYCTGQLVRLADEVLGTLLQEQAYVAKEISRVAGAEQAVD
jgi:hypothetical protein